MNPLAMLATSGDGKAKTYIEDVFSAYAYTGNSSTQTITNGIDLAGKGGLVWTKSRSNAGDNVFIDTVRGKNAYLYSDTTGAGQTATDQITAFNGNGYTLGADNSWCLNHSPYTYVGWTFRKAAKFFDIVTYTGDGASSRAIPHSLGIIPGMVFVKATSSANQWQVYHNSISAGSELCLNSTAASTSNGYFGTTATSTAFYVSGTSGNNTNGSGITYIAYVFAHDTTTDGLIQCGSFTGNATVTLGWEPQYILAKRTDSGSSWIIFDTARGVTTDGSGNQLLAESAAVETSVGTNSAPAPTATGFKFNVAAQNWIYMAIRRGPMKPPTSGTQVYNAVAYTANNTDGRNITGAGFPPDLVISDPRDGYSTPGGPNAYSRLTGNGRFLTLASTSAELDGSASSNGIFGMDGITASTSGTNVWSNVGTHTYIDWFFRRYPGVFDEVCSTGDAVGTALPHNLQAVPELYIQKRRDSTNSWFVRTSEGYQLKLDLTDAATTPGFGAIGTASTFNPISYASGATYVNYLFATLAGISKVFSYTGNGTSQTINCGFSAGARFIMIKRTDAAGDWFIWDTVRGIVAGNDPHLSLNTTAAEVTTDDSIDPDSSGFIVNQLSATNINVNGATYAGFAIA